MDIVFFIEYFTLYLYILDSDPAEFTGLFAAFPSVSVVSVFVRTSRRAGRSGDRRHDSHPQILQILNKKHNI